jgi:hypothetical protein
MLKPLLIATATLFSATFVSLNTAQVANAAAQSHPVQSDRQQLIARGDEPSHLNAQQRSDIKSIHGTLTQFYRGFNQLDVDVMTSVSIAPPSKDVKETRQFFDRLKSDNVDMSFEVKRIDLLELSSRRAVVKVNNSVRGKGLGKTFDVPQVTTMLLVKSQGKWKIKDGYTVVKEIDRNR